MILSVATSEIRMGNTRSYFMDRNTDDTNLPDFNRQLEEQQRNLLRKERGLRDMCASEDMQLVLEQMGNLSNR
ncbi:hypothetical protein J6X90_02030 [Candidatus Saccharibacteria bacterium]|nr:hypothetical protein [Candidatus Saccharibacteria bacterium]